MREREEYEKKNSVQKFPPFLEKHIRTAF